MEQLRKNRKTETIMVVDDTPANLEILEETLRRAGYRVAAFPNGELALKAASKNPPDLVLLDIMMPGMDGFEVCGRFKADEKLKEIPVIFISALGAIQDKIKAFTEGGVDYITKPFRAEEVYARVETHLALQRQKKELVLAYEKQKELESFRDAMVHMVAHDMRSPINIILGNLELAVDCDSMEEAAPFISQAESSTRRLLELISSMLDASKLEAGEMDLAKEPADIKDLVSIATSRVSSLFGRRKYMFDAPDESMVVVCDPEIICRVVWNLLGNALKFTDDESGVVSVKIYGISGLPGDKDGSVRVEIANNGPAIPDEYKEKVFDKFFQVREGNKKRKFSTGLGLAFCKLAVEVHGGNIGVSDGPGGRGVVFWFTLPAGG